MGSPPVSRLHTSTLPAAGVKQNQRVKKKHRVNQNQRVNQNHRVIQNHRVKQNQRLSTTGSAFPTALPKLKT